MNDKAIEVPNTEVLEVMVVNEKSPVSQIQALLVAGAKPEDIEKMMDLQDRWEKGEAKKAFFSAMVKTQNDMPTVFEGRKNTQTHSSYAAYKDIVRVSKPIYSKHGISISFYEKESKKEDYVKWCADVYHELGHCKDYSVSLPIDDKGPKGSAVKTKIHGIKSAMSYGRGILLCSIFNIATNDDVDDDGNSAGSILITEKQVSEITDILNSKYSDPKDIEGFLNHVKIDSVETIQAKDYNKILSILKAST